MVLKLSRRITQAAVLAVIACSASFAGTSSASAAVAPPCSPLPACLNGAGYFFPTTPDNALWEAADPVAGSWIRTIPNGYQLYVVCQANNGPQEDGKTIYGAPFTTWDYAWDSGLARLVWVYDYYMNTDVVGTDGYSADVPKHCNF